ncbi:conjugative relaxase (plasmid) [Polymorphobacter sp. PAMC 29334]|nr:conjugative relaxase [Polymorphobacter sp. PAMC 29334]
MISAASVGGAGAAASYYGKDNYYSAEDLEQSSLWLGAGAEAAGLSGGVALDTFTAILEGKMPDGTVIGVGQTGSHRPGMDLTFSAPKSLSLLAYVAGDERLLDANMAAVKATLKWAEANLAEARTGAGGEKVVKTGNLVVALFQHDTSRNLDPQAHIHAVIANATQTADGKWHALHNDKLWSNNTLLGSIYHAYLREGVTKLG